MSDAKGWALAIAGALTATAMSGCAAVQTARERLVQAPPRCQDYATKIYFDPDSAELTEESRAVIRQAAAAARGCLVDQVEVLGLADAAGAPEANLELSKRRAQSVTAALALGGLPAAEFRVAALGATDAVAPGGETKPLRRRADVLLHLRTPPDETAGKSAR